MKINETVQFDHIVVGSGLAGLSSALHLARSGRSVAVLTKREIYECNSRLAQGGVACVMDRLDSFDEHVKDTLTAGAGLCDIGAVRAIVEAGPAAIQELIELGAKFTTRGELGYTDEAEEFDLGREGGHHKRRILHAGDITGAELERVMIEAVRSMPNIKVFEYHVAIDLVVSSRLDLGGPNRCFGVYVLDVKSGNHRPPSPAAAPARSTSTPAIRTSPAAPASRWPTAPERRSPTWSSASFTRPFCTTRPSVRS